MACEPSPAAATPSLLVYSHECQGGGGRRRRSTWEDYRYRSTDVHVRAYVRHKRVLERAHSVMNRAEARAQGHGAAAVCNRTRHSCTTKEQRRGHRDLLRQGRASLSPPPSPTLVHTQTSTYAHGPGQTRKGAWLEARRLQWALSPGDGPSTTRCCIAHHACVKEIKSE